jgi:hypothetical protein
MLARLNSLVTRWRTRRLRSRPHGGNTRSAPQARTPGGHAWLIRLVEPTAQFAGQIEALLQDPEITALLQAAPQAGRIFRPLCRMLGIALPAPLRRPPPRIRPRQPKPEPQRGRRLLLFSDRRRLRVPRLGISSA